MTTTTNYPNGQVLTSSALTVAQVNTLIQSLTYGMIGLPVPPPSSFQPVQVDWQTQGQPFMAAPAPALLTSPVAVDECYVACTTQDGDYTKIRNRTFSGTGPVVETWVYTREWHIAWTFYGPNAVDRARMIHSAMFMDYFTDSLSLANLFPVSDFNEPTRAPELINAQWYDRADFSIITYEQVTETISDGAVTNVEVKVYEGVINPTGPVADVVIHV